MFERVIADAAKVYEKHKAKKGDSWRTMSILALDDKLTEEYEEQHQMIMREEKYWELIDLINVALMLAERIRIKEDDALLGKEGRK